MSLSARIAIVPSRLLDVSAGLLACGGIVVAAITLVAARDSGGLALVIGGGTALAVVLRRPRDAFTMIVSDRSEIAITRGDDDGGSWRLATATLVWPGFVVLALRPDAGTAACIVPLLDRDVAPFDRRALRRFLTWSLHGGNGIAPPAMRTAGRR